MMRKTKINLLVTVEFDDDDTNAEMAAENLSWYLADTFDPYDNPDYDRDDRLTVLFVSSSEVQS